MVATISPPTANIASKGREIVEQILARRNLARQVMADLSRLSHGWTDNVMTEGQPLTVTLNKEKIDAITKEFSRLDGMVHSLTNCTRDWEIELHSTNSPQQVQTNETPTAAKTP